MNPHFILIFLCLAVGALLRRSEKFPPNAPQAFNAFVIWVSLPALILIQIPALLTRTSVDVASLTTILIPISMAWLLFLLSFVVFNFLGHKLHWPQAQTGALILTAGLGNTSFVGFPILESFFGPQSLPIGVLVDQPGTFLTLSTLGLLVASSFSSKGGQRFRFAIALKNVFKFPPFVALLVAVVWWLSGTAQTGTTASSNILSVLEKLAATLVPLALVGVGMQLNVSRELMARKWKALSLGLAFKLILSPLFFIFLYVIVFSSHQFATRVTVLESAMAPMITAAVVAEEMGLDSEVASLMVGIGIPLSLLTVYLWNQIPLLQAMLPS